MKYFAFLYRTRGFANTFTRALAIFQRFGITAKKSQRNLMMYCRITAQYDCHPSLPATAIIVKRHPETFKSLIREGAELAVHGYRHINYKDLSYEKQIAELQKAIDIFKKNNIPFSGFRCPYISWNQYTLKGVNEKNFLWDSNLSILWKVLEMQNYASRDWNVLNKILSQIYQPKDAQKYHSIPRMENEIVEIPVSLPDDEILTDRLRIRNEEELEEIWKTMLTRSHERGELLTLQLHPERVPIFKDILKRVLINARGLHPPIWVARLGEIAAWWKERSKFSFRIHRLSSDIINIEVNCAPNASLLLKNYNGNNFARFLDGDYLLVAERNFVLKSVLLPIIGISPKLPSNAEKYLKEEGWFYQRSTDKESFSIYLDGKENVDYSNEHEIRKLIESIKKPLIRFWRWPNGCKSAFAITGDIDCLTLFDFFARLIKR